MFSPGHFASPAHAFANVYRRTGVEIDVHGASPHRLVAMLFDGFNEAVAQATGAMEAGNVELKGRALGRAVRIVDEGLKAALDLEGGGQLANDLRDLYGYITIRLTQANLRNDAKALDECKRLMAPLQQAWNEIGAAEAKAA